MTSPFDRTPTFCSICASRADVRYYDWILCGICFGVLSRLLDRQASVMRRLDVDEAFRDTCMLRRRTRR
jgi:hypothetical protein